MNNMAKAALAVLALLTCVRSAAQQASQPVLIYGLVDTAVEYITNTNVQGDSVFRMPSLTGALPSRIGFRGSEDLGAGLQAFFTLETGILLDSGGLNQGNRLFGRAANVGLRGQWGSLTLGRQPNMSFYGYLKSDIMGPNLFSLSSVDTYLPNARSDNAIGYMGKFSDFSVGVTWSAGRDASSAGGPAGTNCLGESAADASACRQRTAMLAWDSASGVFGVGAIYDLMHGGPGAGGGLGASLYTDRRITLNGYVKAGPGRLGGGHIRRDMNALAQVHTDITYLGYSWPLDQRLTWDTQFVRVSVSNSANGAKQLATRFTYALSKRTALYAMAGRVENEGRSSLPLDAGGTVGPGVEQTGVATGLRLVF